MLVLQLKYIGLQTNVNPHTKMFLVYVCMR